MTGDIEALLGTDSTGLPAELELAVKTVQTLLAEAAERVEPFGSTYITGEGADLDVLVYPFSVGKTLTRLTEFGAEPDTGEVYDDAKFFSFRKGRLNVVVCASFEYFEGSWRGAKICKYLNAAGHTLSKSERIRTHEIARGES